MSQQSFQEQNRKEWEETADLLDTLDRGVAVNSGNDFPERYRRICQHLALARHRRYGADLVEER